MSASKREPVTSADADALRRLLASGLTVPQAAEEMGVTRRRAYHIAKQNKIATPMAGARLGRRPALKPERIGAPSTPRTTSDAVARTRAIANELIDEVNAIVASKLSPSMVQDALIAGLDAILNVVEPEGAA